MKKNKLMILSVLTVIFASSCSQMTFNKINTTVYETRQQDIQKGALPYNPVIADLKVDLDKKISGNSIRQINRYNEYELEITKQAALYNAITNSGADVVIDPIFKINITNNDGRDDKITIQAEVSGFFGKYTGIHKADSTELANATYNGTLLYANTTALSKKTIVPDIPDPDPAATAAANDAKKKKKRKILGWTIGSTLILSLGLGLGLGLSGGGFGGF